jgi:hypothetical protein
MRRQYHSRKVDGHELIWDVHRLVDLTRNLPVRQVPLTRIAELDECFWSNGKPSTCRSIALHAQLIQEAHLTYPIILCSAGRVMDGTWRDASSPRPPLLRSLETIVRAKVLKTAVFFGN